MENWLSAISTYGVSFVGLIALAIYVVKKDAEHNTRIDALIQAHTEEIKTIQNKQDESMRSITEALNNNTLALTKLCERINFLTKGDKNE